MHTHVSMNAGWVHYSNKNSICATFLHERHCGYPCHDNCSETDYLPEYYVQDTQNTIHYMRATWEVSSGELLTQQAMREKIALYTKNMYVLQLLLNSHHQNWGTCRIEEYFFACLCQRSLLPMSSVTFRHLPSTPHYCWSTVIPTSSSNRETGGSCLEWDQGCKECGQTAASWNVPALLKCEHLYADMHCHEGALWVQRMSAIHTFCSKWPYAVFLVFCNKLLMLLWYLVSWIPPSELLSCPRKWLPSAFWQTIVQTFSACLVNECVCIYCFDYSLVSAPTNEIQVSSPVTNIMWLRNSLPSLWHCSKKSHSQSHSLHFVRTH
jgi:hypothetical protein